MEVIYYGILYYIVIIVIVVIIIIIIWHYNPLWVFAFPAKSLQVLLPLAVSLKFLLSVFLDLP